MHDKDAIEFDKDGYVCETNATNIVSSFTFEKINANFSIELLAYINKSIFFNRRFG